MPIPEILEDPESAAAHAEDAEVAEMAERDAAIEAITRIVDANLARLGRLTALPASMHKFTIGGGTLHAALVVNGVCRPDIATPVSAYAAHLDDVRAVGNDTWDEETRTRLRQRVPELQNWAEAGWKIAVAQGWVQS